MKRRFVEYFSNTEKTLKKIDAGYLSDVLKSYIDALVSEWDKNNEIKT